MSSRVVATGTGMYTCAGRRRRSLSAANVIAVFLVCGASTLPLALGLGLIPKSTSTSESTCILPVSSDWLGSSWVGKRARSTSTSRSLFISSFFKTRRIMTSLNSSGEGGGKGGCEEACWGAMDPAVFETNAAAARANTIGFVESADAAV